MVCEIDTEYPKFCIVNKIIQAHFTILTSQSRDFYLYQIDNTRWDTFDIWLNAVISNNFSKPGKQGILLNKTGYAYQCEGLSLLDNFIKNENDINIKNNMEHFYDKIDGWFDFPNIYTEMVNKFDSGSYFVEIGSWLGRSTSYMAVEIINSGKDIKFDCIDGWEGSPENKDNTYVINKTLYEEFLKNVEPVLDHINPIKGFSYDVVNNYQDNSIDFLFIDGAHDYESVKKDLIDWYPKVKKNGVIAGHDYNVGNFPGLVTDC